MEGAAPSERLRSAYLETMMEDPGISMEQFLDRLTANDLGSFPAEDIVALLDDIERDVVASIFTQAEAHSSLTEAAGSRVEEARAEFDRLRARIRPSPLQRQDPN